MAEKEIQRQSILYEMNFRIVIQQAGKQYAKGYNFPSEKMRSPWRVLLEIQN
jgi:hypothetical protein